MVPAVPLFGTEH